MFQSSVDREEAILAGKEAVCAAMEEKTGIMIGFQRTNDIIYQVKPIEIPIENVMMYENCLPDKISIHQKMELHRNLFSGADRLLVKNFHNMCHSDKIQIKRILKETFRVKKY